MCSTLAINFKDSDNIPLREIGDALENQLGALGAKPTDENDRIENAKKWIRAESQNIQHIVCENAEIRTLVVDPIGNKEQIIQLISDAVSSVYTFVPCYSLARILFNSSVSSLCKDKWDITT